MKSRIVEQLGQAEILLPGLVAEGLRANDRAKVRLSALQAAAEHAGSPRAPVPDLAPECRRAGVDTLATRTLISGAHVTLKGAIEAPGFAKLGEALLADAAQAERYAAAGDPVIMIRPDVDTADIRGFAAASAIVTAAGGRTAHASLVARQMGKACVVGCAGLQVDPETQRASIDGTPIAEGDWISIDGARVRFSSVSAISLPSGCRSPWTRLQNGAPKFIAVLLRGKLAEPVVSK